MKKILTISVLVLFVFVLACDRATTTITTTASTTQSTTSSFSEITSSTDVSTTHAETTTAVVTTTTQPVTSTTTTTTTSQPTTTLTTTETTTTYDDRSLVPLDCEHLDNIDDWQPIWCDEFSVDGLPDTSKWWYDTGASGWGNSELQYYTASDPDNARVEDGLLHITAIKEDYLGADYTSARLVTKYRGDWEYGRVQIMAKMPSGRGLWSALWMLPTDWEYGGWPDSGEIDIMEYVGYDKPTVYGTIHTAAFNHSLGTQIGFNTDVLTVESEFHLYEMIWEPRKIDLYVDGNKYAFFGFNPEINVERDNYEAWPFDQRFHLIMNIAVGGTWGGAQGVDDAIFPQSMVIDYVRVYQKDYAGMDRYPPGDIASITVQDDSDSHLKIKWEKAVDDVMVKEYYVFVDGVLYDSTSLNAMLISNLEPETQYVIDVCAKDFKGQIGECRTLNVTTDPVQLVTEKIEAEDYLSMSGVTLQSTTDVGGGLNVGWIDTNDYLEYSLRVAESGTYRVSYRVASNSLAGEIKIYSGGVLPLTTTSLPVTGGWQIWTDVISDEFSLNEGVYTFKIRASLGGFNLNYFTFEKVG
ncbi:MAG: family 16 glycosylhydrolase [Bacilli bacterium]|nr:family 16 glycosylhydrolase [Bacilli bacterium]